MFLLFCHLNFPASFVTAVLSCLLDKKESWLDSYPVEIFKTLKLAGTQKLFLCVDFSSKPDAAAS